VNPLVEVAVGMLDVLVRRVVAEEVVVDAVLLDGPPDAAES
jgi:hypothetical protein